MKNVGTVLAAIVLYLMIPLPEMGKAESVAYLLLYFSGIRAAVNMFCQLWEERQEQKEQKEREKRLGKRVDYKIGGERDGRA